MNTETELDFFHRLEQIATSYSREVNFNPETPEAEFKDDVFMRKNRAWANFMDCIRALLVEAINTPAPGGGSARSQLIEKAIDEMTKKLIEYPSTPYTESGVMSMAKMLEALETSKRIDRADVD